MWLNSKSSKLDLFCLLVYMYTINCTYNHRQSRFCIYLGRFVRLNWLFKGSFNRIVCGEIRQIRAQSTLYYTLHTYLQSTYGTDTRRKYKHHTYYFHHIHLMINRCRPQYLYLLANWENCCVFVVALFE